MFSSKERVLLCISSLALAGNALAGNGYIAGISGEADTATGRSVSAFVDYGFTNSTRAFVALARTNTSGQLGGLDTLYADASLEQSLGRFGLRVGAAYWGDSDLLDSNDLRASIFYGGEKGSWSLDYERRDFDFVFRAILQPDLRRTFEFSANGVGAAASLKLGDRTAVFANGMTYDYSQDIRLQPNVDTLRFLSLSRLSLMNSLIDYRVSAGIDFRLADNRVIDFTLARWQTAIDGGKVDSIGLGFIAPSGIASDLELRIAYDMSENFGDVVAFSVGFYFFGD